MADESKDPAKIAADAKAQADKAAKDGKNEVDLAAQFAALNTSIQGIRSLVDSHVTRLNKKIESVRQPQVVQDTGNGDGETLDPRFIALQREVRETSRDSKMARFFQDFPEAREHWTEIMSIMEDEGRAALVATRTEDGRLDFYTSYRNALNDVLARKFKEAQKGAAEATIAAKAANDKARAQADLGASGAESVPENLTLADVEKMTPEEMEKMGLTKLFPGLLGD